MCDVHEDETGATLQFQDGCGARLSRHDPAYAAHIRLARRSQERGHPVGVGIGAGKVITEMVRADNDVPREVAPEGGGALRVLFHGHDGIFRLKPDNLDAGRIGAALAEAARARSPVWFLADKPDLTLFDVYLLSRDCSFPNGTAAAPDNGKSREESCG